METLEKVLIVVLMAICIFTVLFVVNYKPNKGNTRIHKSNLKILYELGDLGKEVLNIFIAILQFGYIRRTGIEKACGRGSASSIIKCLNNQGIETIEEEGVIKIIRHPKLRITKGGCISKNLRGKGTILEPYNQK